jgi:3-oxoacyl-[acyl-carrier protein] reductase
MSARVALVTGASRGIGAATARRLARDGFDVAVNYREGERGAAAVAREIEALGRHALPVRADVSDAAQVASLVDRVARDLGRLDVLVNNAGVYERRGLDATSPEDWDRRLATNLSSCFYAAKAAVPHLRRAGGGRIVNLTSVLAFRGTSHGTEYVASKAGIVGLTKALALELAKDRILVNAVAPGSIDTDILAGDTPDTRARRIEGIPLRRIGTPDDVAAAISFLVGPGGDYITGQVLHVNGGLLSW